MNTIEVEFPRHEFTPAKRPYLLGLIAGVVISALMIPKSSAVIARNGLWTGSGVRALAGVALLAVCMVAFRKLCSGIDFSKVMLTIDHEGVSVAPSYGTATTDKAGTSISWSSIAKIKYYVTGRLRENKTIIIEMRDPHQRDVRIDANLLRCDNPRELYETMKRYHRQFAPPNESDDAAKGRVYQSASWTGLDDD